MKSGVHDLFSNLDVPFGSGEHQTAWPVLFLEELGALQVASGWASSPYLPYHSFDECMHAVDRTARNPWNQGRRGGGAELISSSGEAIIGWYGGAPAAAMAAPRFNFLQRINRKIKKLAIQ
jgi:hypothetical protein